MSRIKFYVIILFLLTSTFSFGQEISANQGYAEPKEYFVSVPYTEVKGKIIIEIIINNKLRKFILDTGAPTAISENLYKEISPRLLGNVEISDQSGLKDSIKVVSLSNIELKGVNFKDIPAIVVQDSKIFLGCFGAEGFIGSNLLRNSVVQFDYQSKTVTITDNPKGLELKKKYSSKMELNGQSNPYISIALKKGKNTATERILFDTGDDQFYILSVGAFNQLFNGLDDVFDKIAESKGAFSVGMHGIAKDAQHYLVNIPTLTFNSIDFNNVYAKTTYAETSRFGSAILKFGKTTLDYRNKRFYFESFGNKSMVELNEKVWPIEPTLEEDKLVVGIIWDDKLKDQINLGDKIIEFDGVDYQKLDFCQIVRSNYKSDKEKVRLVLKDRNTGKTKTIEINKLL